MNRYIPRTGARITKAQAEFIGEIAEKNGGLDGKDAARALVKASRSPSAPTHVFFARSMKDKARDWDIIRARGLLRSVAYVVEHDRSGEPTKTVRAFVHLRPTEDEVGGYFPTAAAVKSPVNRERVFAEVERRLRAARAFAGEIKELAQVIDAAIAETRRLRKRRKTA